jgi:hypothetical protein
LGCGPQCADQVSYFGLLFVQVPGERVGVPACPGRFFPLPAGLELRALPAAVGGRLAGFPDQFVVLEGQALRFGVGMAQVTCELSPLPEKHAQPRATENGHAPPFSAATDLIPV